jgi:hypothetical protein
VTNSRLQKIALLTGALVIVAAISAAVSSQSAVSPGSGSFKELSICGLGGKSLCKVGAVGPGGGTIFYVDSSDIYNSFNYLEAAPATWAGDKGIDPTTTWCSSTTVKIEKSSTAWSSRAVGLGSDNTRAMLDNCSSGASTLITSYNASSSAKKRDWFLPSLGEMMLMSQNLQGLAGLIDSDYWSSSEYSAIGGWVQAVGHGYQGNATKDTTFHVRPVRSF